MTKGDGKNVFVSLKRVVLPVSGFIAYELDKVENQKLSGVSKCVPAGGALSCCMDWQVATASRDRRKPQSFRII